MNATSASVDPANETRASSQLGVGSPSFLALLAVQALSVMNDNIFRWLAIGIGKQYVSPAQVSTVLMIGTIALVAPYLVLAAPSGYLADRFSKRQVILYCKFAEIVLMALGVLAIVMGQLTALFVVLAMMGAQSALFSPAKFGAIPELVHPDRISTANGLMGLTTVLSTVVGSAVGSWLTDATGVKGQEKWWLSAAAILSVAAVGWLVSFLIVRRPAANPSLSFPWNAIPQTYRDLRQLASNRPLLRVALGIAFFWSLGALAQLNIDRFAAERGAFQQTQVAPLLAALAFGVAAGSVLAGIWSQGRVELGIVPLGGLIIAFCSMLLFTVHGTLVEMSAPAADAAAGATGDFTGAYGWAAFLLFLLGVGAGLFDVPLESYLQHRSAPETRGAVLAASNFLTFGGMSLVSVLFAILRWPVTPPGGGQPEPFLSADQIFLVCGLLTIPVCAYIVFLIPQATIRFVVWLASHSVYRLRVHGRENLPLEGGAVLVANHASWLDGFLLLLTSSRPVRAIAWTGPLSNPWVRRLANLFGTIPIDPARPKSIIAALKTAREAALNGEIVAIFPEGAITRTGQLQGFRPGMMRIVEGTSIPVIPVFLSGVWGSLFSFSEGRFLWKWPRQWPYRIDIHFGTPITAPEDIQQVRQAVLKLGSEATSQRVQRMRSLGSSFIRRCKKSKWRSKVADSLGTDLPGGQLLMRTLILRRLLRREVLGDDEQYVGVLLPPSAGGAIANIAVALDRRISVNLNYTVTNEVMNACIEMAGIRHVLTTRKFLEKTEFKLNAEVVFIEDLRDKVTLLDKVTAGLQTYVLPSSLVEASLGTNKVQADDVLTIIFTSGSTGTPKGVMLTYGNIASNVEAIETVVRLTADDVLIGILPFFHSFGYTVTLWTALSLDVKAAYHFNPLDAKQVGKLCKTHKGTVLLATPTFLRTYLRRCEKDEFASLNVVVAGAEKLPLDLCDAFEQKFGVRPAEGYGTTELSPLVSVNVPPSRSLGSGQIDRKEGTVGRPAPGITAKITDLDTGKELPVGQSGMLWVAGPNVMKGYLHRPDLTEKVVKDGWYMTGDIAFLDDDGFITITGRESRFSKIGGEMVPHILIEETLNKAIGINEEEGLKAIVTSVPDAKKGERLVVIHLPIDKSPLDLQQALMDAGLPNLFIPSPDSYHQVDNLPILGTGKLDLKAVKQMALDAFKE